MILKCTVYGRVPCLRVFPGAGLIGNGQDFSLRNFRALRSWHRNGLGVSDRRLPFAVGSGTAAPKIHRGPSWSYLQYGVIPQPSRVSGLVDLKELAGDGSDFPVPGVKVTANLNAGRLLAPAAATWSIMSFR
jgi:hypothetical protein